MIIYFTGHPRCTRRALRCDLRKGISRIYYHAPVGRCALYCRIYVIPRNPRTPPQVRMRNLFGALAKNWLALLTSPQRQAWNLYARRIHRRWRPGRRTLTGQQAYVKLNSVLGRIGRPPLLWPPPQPAPFRPNPVQELRLRWDAGRLRLEVLVAPRPKGDFLLFASAPCSPGWSRMRRPVFLGLLPAPINGVSDITPLYLARFPAPAPNQQVFIQTRQHRHGWEGPAATHSARVPPTPAPQPPRPSPCNPFNPLNSFNPFNPLSIPHSAFRTPHGSPLPSISRPRPVLTRSALGKSPFYPLQPPLGAQRPRCPRRSHAAARARPLCLCVFVVQLRRTPHSALHIARAPLPFPSRASVPYRLLILILILISGASPQALTALCTPDSTLRTGRAPPPLTLSQFSRHYSP